jgi:hypothetical protein
MLLSNVGQGAELGRIALAVGDADSHHEVARRLAAEEYAQPLQAFSITLSNAFPTLPGIAGQVVHYVQAVLLFLVLFYLVQGGPQ